MKNQPWVLGVLGATLLGFAPGCLEEAPPETSTTSSSKGGEGGGAGKGASGGGGKGVSGQASSGGQAGSGQGKGASGGVSGAGGQPQSLGGAAGSSQAGGATSGSAGSGSGGASGAGGDTGNGGAAGTCGDGKIDPGEDCDGAALGGATCATLGSDKGSLGCSEACHFDASGCCKDQCPGPSGALECASANTAHTCGQFDSDECLEWGNDQQCSGKCDQGQCVCGSDADCPIQQDQCHASQGKCSAGKCFFEENPAGTPCDDGNKCTQGDTCQAGVCVGGGQVACAPLDACHVAGICNPATGQCSSLNAANGIPCSDQNGCTQLDTCQAGVCVGANPVACSAQDSCHVAGVCNPATGQCSNPGATDGTPCDDGDACTKTDACQSAACVGVNPVICTAQDSCHLAGVCNPATGQCSSPIAGNGTGCDDGNACTKTDTCQNGQCAGSSPVVCSAQDQCHLAGVCDPATGQCSNPNAPGGALCNDGNACTLADACQAGVCVGTPMVCNSPPNGQCYSQAGICNGGQCSYTPKPFGSGCNDADLCTQGDVCDGNGVCGGAALQCNSPPGQCYDPAGFCNGGSCSYSPALSNSPCNDGDSCTQNDTCNGGGACLGTPMVCNTPPSSQCYNQAGVCNGGACQYTPQNFGTPCNDGDSCTQNDICNGGGACFGAAITCNSPPGECWNSSGSCGGGSCQYTQKTAGTSCSVGVCQSGSCVACLNGQNQSTSCNPGTYCPSGTKSRTCSGGQWGAYSSCSAASSSRYCGDGSKVCGPVICIQIQPSCSSSTATAVITKADGLKFTNNANVTIYSPTTGKSTQYGCLSSMNQSSITVQFSPSSLGFNTLGNTWAVNAQLLSPCAAGANYISGNGYVSQCSN